MPGLEAAMKEYEENPPEEIEEADPEVENQFGKTKEPEKETENETNNVTDAAPRPLYVRRDVMNTQDIYDWAKALINSGIIDEYDLVDDLHVTVAYSKTPVDWMKMGETWHQEQDGTLTISKGGPRLVEPLGDQGAIVLMFTSNNLVWRHMGMIENGASWDFDSYQPHVTIAYSSKYNPVNKSDLMEKLNAIKPYAGEIKFGPEVFEDIQ